MLLPPARLGAALSPPAEDRLAADLCGRDYYFCRHHLQLECLFRHDELIQYADDANFIGRRDRIGRAVAEREIRNSAANLRE